MSDQMPTPVVPDILVPFWVEMPPCLDMTRNLTPLQFLELLTSSEETAFAAASQSNPELFTWYGRLVGASLIDLDDIQTIAGLDAAVTAGIMTAERVATVLRGLPRQ